MMVVIMVFFLPLIQSVCRQKKKISAGITFWRHILGVYYHLGFTENQPQYIVVSEQFPLYILWHI